MSRRDQIRMTDAEVDAYLAESPTMILNSIGRDGVPHPMPMWFAREDDGSVVMTTFTKSQKIHNLRRDPRVSLLVEGGTVYAQLSGVVIYGTAELLPETDDVLDILVRVTGRQGALESGATGTGDLPSDAVRAGMRQTAEKRTGIRVRPESVVSWDHRKLGGTY